MHIAETDVAPAHAHQGFGAALLARACNEAAARTLDHVTLTTFADLPWSAPFYARHGFAPVQALDAFPHLARALQRERARGLTHRIAMVWHVRRS